MSPLIVISVLKRCNLTVKSLSFISHLIEVQNTFATSTLRSLVKKESSSQNCIILVSIPYVA